MNEEEEKIIIFNSGLRTPAFAQQQEQEQLYYFNKLFLFIVRTVVRSSRRVARSTSFTNKNNITTSRCSRM